MKIASWNVNSLKVRLPHLTQWLADAQPDVVALQETKLEDAKFPVDELAAAGYRAVFSGQKTYNGVAILARDEPRDIVTDIPGLDDPQRRILAASVGGLRVVNLYVVNGKAVGDPKYAYKLDWLARVRDFLADELARHPRLVVLGDFNICPDDRDVYDATAWGEDILCSPPERAGLKAITDLGLHDSFRLFEAEGGHYSWWDYRQAAFRRNMGLRIDLILIGEALKSIARAATIDREPRRWERPSDHTPVMLELDLGTSP
ncbi:exodeoxyribonuclease III [Rhodanobacter fulvus Jip2]|uniref:Exodeoxyribonuclease III n=1 Tax=Rhodanobacter fulvus Jip2 TaxID=1163408 RepID=I4VLU1_9GAMM|nr:exodeoxyribonuclease III [Rhodanobacter fulvus]EIL88182.1 exodeoxyribonuclease III [Rhodanobacter fulvus Jip2]